MHLGSDPLVRQDDLGATSEIDELDGAEGLGQHLAAPADGLREDQPLRAHYLPVLVGLEVGLLARRTERGAIVASDAKVDLEDLDGPAVLRHVPARPLP